MAMAHFMGLSVCHISFNLVIQDLNVLYLFECTYIQTSETTFNSET